MRDLLQEDGYAVELFADGPAFFEAYRPGREGCVLVDALMPGMSGIELIERLKAEGHELPAIVITGNGAVPMAVQAMKAGAVDFIEKPVGHEDLLASVKRALDQTRDAATLSASRETALTRVASLTARQRQILDLVLAGHPSKNIAADLGISQRTVDNHRAAIMRKTGSKSLPALVRTALAAALNSSRRSELVESRGASIHDVPVLLHADFGPFTFPNKLLAFPGPIDRFQLR